MEKPLSHLTGIPLAKRSVGEAALPRIPANELNHISQSPAIRVKAVAMLLHRIWLFFLRAG
jgi:hypothetical protein